jgi:hypothetical protein
MIESWCLHKYMKNNTPTLSLSSPLKFALALSCVALMAPLQSSSAADPVMPPAAAGEMRVLPLTAHFDKVSGGEKGPYVLKLTNDSKESLSVEAKVLLSVAFHADDKARHVPSHVIKPSKTWSIKDLAATDKVIVSAKGFAPLELTVP